MELYETNEYIVSVMKAMSCPREDALELIEEFKRIDDIKDKVRQVMTNNDLLKAYRKDWKAQKRCICCGRQDEDTLSGLTRCRRCSDYQRQYMKEYYEKYGRRKRNATGRQNT